MGALILESRPPLADMIRNRIRQLSMKLDGCAGRSGISRLEPADHEAVVVVDHELGSSGRFDEVTTHYTDVLVEAVGTEMHVTEGVLLEAFLEVNAGGAGVEKASCHIEDRKRGGDCDGLGEMED